MTTAITNRRVITRKGQSIAEWWAPIQQWLSVGFPILVNPGLSIFAKPYSAHLKIAETDRIIVFPNLAPPGLRITATLISATPRGIVHFTLFDSGFDSEDLHVAWRICSLLESIFNGSPIDIEHQQELELLLFSV
jgi:hypothetical protein